MISRTSIIWLTRLLVLGLFALIAGGVHLAWPRHAPQSLDLFALGIVVLSASIAAWLGCYLLVRFDALHARFTHDHDLNGVQKIHAQPVPRVGGLAIMLGLLIALLMLPVTAPGNRLGVSFLLWLLLAALPVFITGLWEDITKRVSIRQRLLSAFISAELAALLLQALIPGLGLPWLDHYLTLGPGLLLLTIVGTGGVTHSYNLVDGINGLTAGFTVIMLGALLTVAALVGDGVILTLGGVPPRRDPGFPGMELAAGPAVFRRRWGLPAGLPLCHALNPVGRASSSCVALVPLSLGWLSGDGDAVFRLPTRLDSRGAS